MGKPVPPPGRTPRPGGTETWGLSGEDPGARHRRCRFREGRPLPGGRRRRLRGNQDVFMKVHVNGRDVELEQPTPLLDYIAGLGLDWRAVAVEHNGIILDRDEFEAAVLNQDDSLEIVRMVGGG